MNRSSIYRMSQRTINKRVALRRGVAAVEAAIVLPVIALILLGSIDVGQSVYVAQVVNEASREGARQACRYDTTSEDAVRTSVRDFLRSSFSGITDGDVAVNFNDSNGGAIPNGDLSLLSEGTPISVEVVLQYSAVRWTPGFAGLGGSAISTTTIMRRE